MTVHLNDNILCVVDVETTGPTPRYHDIIEICVLPLNRFLKPDKKIVPFMMDLVPMRKENIDYEALRITRGHMDHPIKDKICWKKDRLIDLTLKGCEPSRAADLFVEWVDRLKLATFKRIMVVAHNWPFDREFIIDWLGYPTFEVIFDPRFRDTMAMSLYDNDIADYHVTNFPYPKNNLSYLCSQLGVDRPRIHTAVDDCVATAECYRKMIHNAQRFGNENPAQEVVEES
jgi:DNA polymerase III epsilon subunit-like protein